MIVIILLAFGLGLSLRELYCAFVLLKLMSDVVLQAELCNFFTRTYNVFGVRKVRREGRFLGTVVY